MAAITVYGSGTCEDTERSRDLLDQLSIGYTYVDLDLDAQSASYAASLNGGHLKTPTITFDVGSPLIEPTDEELMSALEQRRLLPGQSHYLG